LSHCSSGLVGVQVLVVNGGTLHADNDHSNTLHREGEFVMTYTKRRKKRQRKERRMGKEKETGARVAIILAKGTFSNKQF